MRESVSLTVGRYSVECSLGEPPLIFPTQVARAVLYDEFDRGETNGTRLVVAVSSHADTWPTLLISQRCWPGNESSFTPGILLVPATNLLFIGAGTRLLAYDLARCVRLWEDDGELGFWNWRHEDGLVLMAAELEFAAWDERGVKLWTTFVEPPWTYTIENGTIALDVMGVVTRFSAWGGPAHPL